MKKIDSTNNLGENTEDYDDNKNIHFEMGKFIYNNGPIILVITCLIYAFLKLIKVPQIGLIVYQLGVLILFVISYRLYSVGMKKKSKEIK